MPEWGMDIIKVTIGVALALLAHWVAFARLKWKLRQDRKTAWAKKREPIYAEGLGIVYDVEKNQTNVKELDRILKKWADWFPSNAIYLPPTVNDALYGAMHWTVPVTIDLVNEGKVNQETWQKFKEELQKAKTMLMESKDIGWLPEDLR
jgi:hypothetical protein